jgi:AcrR family transcriptional regulator
MSSNVAIDGAGAPEATRRRLTARQARTVVALTEGCVEELRSVGFDGLTVRNVARRAGVAPATAYTYFGSREHLVTEVFWRRLQALPDAPVDRRRTAAARAAAAVRGVALLVADEPELAAACTTAMLANDPDVAELRLRIGLETRRRVANALGDDASESVMEAIDLVVSGALVHAGMGHLGYEDLPARLDDAIGLIVGGHR